ncbi:FliH/SctL family protein [Salinibacterium sp. SYSU T00001]|uniref:FliH/SctL family protein n=1 Tax=Homoserinimonas sedimenticola TaxID=2986805 RepID=UPI0022360C5A|nr:FliH/SctL family protein [Salinibacterium sedimenticola]MCW4385733.1 FliH/SctL family protein [Salinibacterium sedimenticola]
MSTEAAFSPLHFPALGSTPGLVEEQARTRGYASGYAAGMRAAEQTLRTERAAAAAEHARLMDEGRARIDSLAALLTAAVDAVGARVAPVLEEAQKQLAAASVDLAETIIGVELADGPTSARAVVERALRDVDPAVVLSVRVHPETLAALDEAALVDGLNYSADPGLAPGDAIVDFPDGYLDARIGAAVARARAALAEGHA